MKKLHLLIVISVFSVSCFASDGGWVSLFNGKNLKGWKRLNGDAEFVVKDGELVGISKTGTPNTFLATKKVYGDFILEYEMIMEEGLNSGVQIRSLSKKDYNNGLVHGYQVECDDSERAWTAGIYDEGRRGWLYPLEYNRDAKKVYKRGEWNSFRVEAVGNSIRTWMNGIPCANLVDDMTAEGFIALQVHGIGKNEEKSGRTIRWRNIRIKTDNLEGSRRVMDSGVREVSYLNNTLTERERRDGWKLLWDGKTTDGWRKVSSEDFPDKGWALEDGVLVVNPTELKEERGGDIVTRRKYKSFILEFDFKFTKGANSGIKYFVQADLDEGGIRSGIGCEYQVIDDKNHSDASKGKIAGLRSAASVYDLIPPDGSFFDKHLKVKRLRGGWNRGRVEVRGSVVMHFLNGIKVVEYDRSTQMWKALVAHSKFKDFEGFGEFEEGRILIQDHSDKVFYKNIKIKEL